MLAASFARVLRLSDDLGHVFAALADPTRRWMVEALLRDGTTSVPALSAALPITRQAVAKHLARSTTPACSSARPAPGARSATACAAGRSRRPRPGFGERSSPGRTALVRLKDAVESGALSVGALAPALEGRW